MEMIIQCTVYLGKNSGGELHYLVDLKRVVGEMGLFLWKCNQMAELLS